MKTIRSIAMGAVFALIVSMAFQLTGQDTKKKFQDGKGGVWFTHSGNDTTGNPEAWIKFKVFKKNLTTGTTDLIGIRSWPAPAAHDDSVAVLLPVDETEWKIGAVAFDKRGNASDTAWAPQIIYTQDPDTIPPEPPCGITCYRPQ